MAWSWFLEKSFRPSSCLHGRPLLQKLVTNTGWLMADKLLRMAVGFGVGVWLARYLSVEQFGIYSYGLSFVALFGALGSMGLDSIVVRDLVRHPDDRNSILGTTFFLKLVGGGAAAFLASTTVFLFRPVGDPVRAFVCILSLGVPLQAFETIDYWFQSQVKAKITVYAKNAVFLVIAILKVSLILLQAPLMYFGWAAIAETALGGIALCFVYRLSKHHLLDWRVTEHRVRSLVKDGWPVLFSALSVMVYMRVDQLMLGEMIGNESVGIYGVATRLSELWYFIPMAVVTSVMPVITESKSVSSQRYYYQITLLFRFLLVISLLITVPVCLGAPFLVNFLYGDAYGEAGKVLAVHIWSAVFIFLNVAQWPWVMSEGLMKTALLRTVLGAVMNVLLNLQLIPYFSAMGATFSTVISYAVVAVVANVFDRRTRIILSLQWDALLFFKARPVSQ